MTKNVVVTGGSSGIGAAVIARLLNAECDVWNLDVVSDAPEHVSTVHCDLADPAGVAKAVSELPARIDAFISVAGVAPGAVPDTQGVAINFLAAGLAVLIAQDWFKEGGRTPALLGAALSFLAGICSVARLSSKVRGI